MKWDDWNKVRGDARRASGNVITSGRLRPGPKVVCDENGRVCSKCKHWQPWEEYRRRTRAPTGHQSWCRGCENTARAVRRGDLAPDRPPMTYEEIGEEMGISKQRVQQIEATALRKLKNNSHVLRMVRQLLEGR